MQESGERHLVRGSPDEPEINSGREPGGPKNKLRKS